LNCEKITERTETYLNLSVDVEQNTSLAYCLKKYISKGKNLYQYLFKIWNFSHSKILYKFLNTFLELMKKKDKFYCDNCNSLQEAERQ